MLLPLLRYFVGGRSSRAGRFPGALMVQTLIYRYDVNVDQVKGTAANLLAAKDELIGDVGDVGDERGKL